ncbi:MAG TPA: SDR family oxidoreductase [Brevundimonas sp.]|jgi:short-subunit dehydrogenase|uniref:SDR family oxidoreductase n=1 Tax=Brevundimonas sp. TaxID=1871086 RepID=UPI002E137693|nr:SDR family oxidoreductase [Brevundimonas sp.]
MSRRLRLKPLSQQVVVITGATSGIGLATARRAAAAGACVFLIARHEEDLRLLCETLQRDGGRCAWAVADVGDATALEAAAEKCERLFGGIDTWVNNAGAAAPGSLREMPLAEQRALFETNYWGVVNGSLAAAARLAGRGGAIINVGSSLADAPAPGQGVYAASKHAVKGFTQGLRLELARAGAPVAVTLVKPAAVDTAWDRRARRLGGYAARHPQPVYAAHVVADAILHCAAHPVREITVGGGGRLIAAAYAALPGVAEPLFAAFAPVVQPVRGDDPWADDGLDDPTADPAADEVRYPMVRQFSVLAEARKHPGVTAGGLGALVLLGLIAVLLGQRKGPTRYERWRARLDPRGWTAGWRRGFEAALDGLGDGAQEVGHRADRARREAGRNLDRLTREARRRLPREELQAGLRSARRGADRAGRFARDHAREGGVLAALLTVGAAVAVAALDGRPAKGRRRPPLRL